MCEAEQTLDFLRILLFPTPQNTGFSAGDVLCGKFWLFIFNCFFTFNFCRDWTPQWQSSEKIQQVQDWFFSCASARQLARLPLQTCPASNPHWAEKDQPLMAAASQGFVVITLNLSVKQEHWFWYTSLQQSKVYQILFLNPFLINSPPKSYLFITLLKSNFCISQSLKLFPQALPAGKWHRIFPNSHMTISSINFSLSSSSDSIDLIEVWKHQGLW